MRRILLTAAAVAAIAVPASVATVGLASPAGAAAVTITCTTITGTATTTITVSGCTGGNTGGSSLPVNSLALANGGTITWTSGSTTTIGKPVLTTTSAKKCPGYVKGGTSNPTADKFAASVTGDTGNGIKVPGTSTGAICIGSASTGSNITALKPLKTK